MGQLTAWGQSQVVALIRIRTSLKFRALKHPLGSSVENSLRQIQDFPFWVLMSLVLNCGAWLTIWLVMTMVHTARSYLRVIFILPIKKLLDLLRETKRRLTYTASCMVQETRRSVRSLVKGHRTEKP